jgi:hypothetical protein
MPTFQSTPAMPWIFPDEAYHMNRKGMQPLKPAPVSSLDLLDGGESEAHALFSDHARRMVHERLRVNKKKESGMLGHGEMNARSQRYVRPASRSAVPNGVFHGSPMEYAASSGLRGGVITTKEGQEWLAKRLKERAQEYAELASGQFSPRPPRQIEVTPYVELDSLLQVAFTAFTSGTFSSSLNETLNRLLQSLIKVGATISPSQLTTYSQAISKMIETTRSYTGANLGEELGLVYEGREKRLRGLDAVNETLKIIDAAIKEIARVIYEPLSVREQVMTQLQSRLIGRQLELFKPGFISEERQAAVEAVRPIELGRPRQPGPLIPGPKPPAAEPESMWGAPAGEEGDAEEEEEFVLPQFGAPPPAPRAPPLAFPFAPRPVGRGKRGKKRV